MPFPWANTILLLLLIFQFATGFLGLTSGATNRAWALWTHGIGAYAMAVILFWKAVVVWKSLGRRRRSQGVRVAFLVLAGLLLLTLGTGFLWSFAGRRLLGGYSLITIHILLAVAVAVLLLWHVAAMRFIFRVPAASNRRAFLHLGIVAAAGLVLSQLAGWAVAASRLPGARRRFTGSYETGSFTGVFPTVIWLSDTVPIIEEENWSLAVDGLVERPFSLTYPELLELAGEPRPAILDCTGGWYSDQEWSGVGMGMILDRARVRSEARSVFVRSVTGYWRRYPVEEARGFLLATTVAGRTLDTDHGFPARLVAPGRRGYEWVKWVVQIRLDPDPPLAQPPLPLQ